jgi:hypothetical protein
MSATASVLSGLQGALLLARGRAEGVTYVSDDMSNAARSFWAAVMCTPLLVAVVGLSWLLDGRPADPAHAAAMEFLSYVIGWAGYAVISRPIVAAVGRAQHWPRFIAVWNWCNVVQYAMLLVGMVPGAVGAPYWLSETTQLVGQGWALWLEWFAIRLALGVTGLQAGVVMAPDVLLGLVLAAIASPA